jgi:hypothetical protein
MLCVQAEKQKRKIYNARLFSINNPSNANKNKNKKTTKTTLDIQWQSFTRRVKTWLVLVNDEDDPYFLSARAYSAKPLQRPTILFDVGIVMYRPCVRAFTANM